MDILKLEKHIDKIKSLNGCDECGFNDPRALDFAHIDPSTKFKLPSGKTMANMYAMLQRCDNKNKELNKKRIHELFLEIRKCRILCANHHRIETKERKEYGGNGGRQKITKVYPNLVNIIHSYKTSENTKHFSSRKISKLLLEEHMMKVSYHGVLQNYPQGPWQYPLKKILPEKQKLTIEQRKQNKKEYNKEYNRLYYLTKTVSKRRKERLITP